ncbi:MAG: zinc-ribbon domain-containing protein [Pseudomonadota bacterium]
MRLICPNCKSEYEVGDDAIPPGGREVQCSNCAQTWYQTDKPVAAPAPAEEAAAGTEADTEDAASDEIPPAAPVRKPLDAAVAEILREEAARGDNLPRGGNAVPPPTQPAPKPAEVIDAGKTRERIAQMTIDEGGVTSAQAATGGGAAAAAAGANLRTIPDIQEINAALRARAQASDTSGLTEEEKEQAAERRGFRGGFFGVLILLALAIAPYFLADQITENLPQTADMMATYMETVDGLRDWLTAQVETVRGMIGGNEVGNG